MYMNESCEFEKNGENDQRETKDIIDEENILEMSTSFHYPVISMVIYELLSYHKMNCICINFKN